MKTVTSTQVKNTFGAVMDSALAEPVMVKKSGRSSVVIISAAEYERLIAIEDNYWINRAIQTEASGFASAEEVQSLLKDAQGA